MCRAVRCKVCGKTTWAGCGKHVEEVLRAVPRDDRCSGQHEKASRGGMWKRLVGRG